jgi:carbon-monoxide dehydrogenase large subunit
MIDVLSKDVGGSFGSKIFVYGEECLCLWAARKLNAPVKWSATRGESFAADVHGRDHLTEAAIALDKDALITAIKVNTLANLGAYLSPFGSLVPTYNYAMMLAGALLNSQCLCGGDRYLYEHLTRRRLSRSGKA